MVRLGARPRGHNLVMVREVVVDRWRDRERVR